MANAGAVQRPDTSPLDALGIDIRHNAPLASLTTMKVGGAADYFAGVKELPALTALVQWAHGVDLPYLVLGGGSNVLISDAGIRGLVIHNRCRALRIERGETQIRLTADSGAAMAGIARATVRAGLTGLEWAVSVPGTLGGAVIGNAGAHGGEVKDNLRSITVLERDVGVVEMAVHELAYAYRNSALKRLQLLQAGFKPVVLSATFDLEAGDPDRINADADRFLAHRRRTQPVEPSLGSTFVNPPGDFAGRLIEAAGLKGKRYGGAVVSETHANFIINPGGVGAASAGEVMTLIRHIQETVFDQFGIQLELEVQLAGAW